MVDAASDTRYKDCTAHGRSELQVYLDWLEQTKIKDSEYSFVAFALGRAGLKDVRHLFLIWSLHMAGAADRKMRSQIRRFFFNPSAEISFQVASMAGWFNFLEELYKQARSGSMPPLQPPTFVKVGFSDLPP